MTTHRACGAGRRSDALPAFHKAMGMRLAANLHTLPDPLGQIHVHPGDVAIFHQKVVRDPQGEGLIVFRQEILGEHVDGVLDGIGRNHRRIVRPEVGSGKPTVQQAAHREFLDRVTVGGAEHLEDADTLLAVSVFCEDHKLRIAGCDDHGTNPAFVAPMTHSAELLNTLTAEAFTARLGGVYEHSPWIADAVAGRRPFAVDGLKAALRDVVDRPTRRAQLALIRAHPDLAGDAGAPRATDPGVHPRADRRGTGRDDHAGAGPVTAANVAYRARFGFPFLSSAPSSYEDRPLEAITGDSGTSPPQSG